jgi:hypothetical protein
MLKAVKISDLGFDQGCDIRCIEAVSIWCFESRGYRGERLDGYVRIGVSAIFADERYFEQRLSEEGGKGQKWLN